MHSASVLLAQHWLSTLFIILFIGTIGGKIANRFNFPDVVAYILIGLLLGPGVSSVINVPVQSLVNQTILIFGASFIIFHGGLITNFHVLKKVWITIILLSIIGVVITASTVAWAVSFFFFIPFTASLLLGSILASTDPAALVPIFQRFHIKEKVSHTVIAESAFTDASGAIMTTVVFTLLTSATKMNWGFVPIQFLQLSGGGIIIGIIIGLFAAFLISENDHSSLLREYTPMVMVLTVLAAYLIGEWLKTSGFMAVFTAGLIIGNADFFKLTISQKEEKDAHQFMDLMSLKLRMLIFVLLGSQVNFAVLGHYGIKLILIPIVFIFIARPLSVLACMLPDRKARWEKNEILFLFWTRETGVIAAALVGIISSSSLPNKELFSAITFIIILTTLILQASTTPALAKKLGLLR